MVIAGKKRKSTWKVAICLRKLPLDEVVDCADDHENQCAEHVCGNDADGQRFEFLDKAVAAESDAAFLDDPATKEGVGHDSDGIRCPY